jgi:acyl carrier protein
MGAGARLQWRAHFCCIIEGATVMRAALGAWPCGRPTWANRIRKSQGIRVASLSLSPEQTVEDVAEVLAGALALAGDVAAGLTRDTLLFGSLPELDSMAVATVLTALEDRFGILIDDDEVSGELFESVGTLADFVSAKLSAT